MNGITFTGGNYEVKTVPSSTTFTVTFATAATGSGSGTGGTVTLQYEYPSGSDIFSIGTGWGAGPWSRSTWGSAYTSGVANQLRLWSNDNFGADLVIAPRGGPVSSRLRPEGHERRDKTLPAKGQALLLNQDGQEKRQVHPEANRVSDENLRGRHSENRRGRPR